MELNQPTNLQTAEMPNLNDSKLVRVSIDVPLSVCEYREKNHMKWRQLISLGVLYSQQMPPMRSRMEDMERNIEKMSKMLTKQAQRIYELEGVDHAPAIPRP